MADSSENNGAGRNFYGSNIENEVSASKATVVEVDEESETLLRIASNALIRQVGLNSHYLLT